jgi:hypothetical protein
MGLNKGHIDAMAQGYAAVAKTHANNLRPKNVKGAANLRAETRAAQMQVLSKLFD